VACAANGREALDHLGGPDRPCLILLDLSMPVMDGWEFLARQRRSPLLAHIPVILVSAEGDLPRLATSLGVAGYFPKPVEAGGLLRAIRVLGGGRAPALAAD
jgi:CheY-like chemotaxis protein